MVSSTVIRSRLYRLWFIAIMHSHRNMLMHFCAGLARMLVGPRTGADYGVEEELINGSGSIAAARLVDSWWQ